MRPVALLVLALAGCAPEASGSVVESDAPMCGFDEDGMSLAPVENAEDVGEAHEAMSGLSVACLLVVSVAVEIGCNEGVIDGWYPPGTEKEIHDTWVTDRTMKISCDTLRYVVCGSAAAGGVELMRRACLAV